MKLPPYFYAIPFCLTGLGLVVSCGGNDSGGDGDSSGDGDGDGDVGDGDGDVVGDGDGDGDLGGAGGGSNMECENDGDPCTEDVFNEETGKCGIPRSGNACDDGVYCNGDDVCMDGECVAGDEDPCPETSCNEGTDACECETVEHCPGESIGDDEWGAYGPFSECEYENVCVETGTRSRVKTTYECSPAGECVATQGVDVDNACGARTTDCECMPGTWQCDPYTTYASDGVTISSQGELLIKCLTNGTWESSHTATCAIDKCDTGLGECTTGFYHPRDRDFDVPKLIQGLPGLERGAPIDDVLNHLGLHSEFG